MPFLGVRDRVDFTGGGPIIQTGGVRERDCFLPLVPMPESIQDFARQVIEVEATAVRGMVETVDEQFEKVARLILDCPGAVLTSGMGKAGYVARKLSATFS